MQKMKGFLRVAGAVGASPEADSDAIMQLKRDLTRKR
jgi:hypothetical protein